MDRRCGLAGREGGGECGGPGEGTKFASCESVRGKSSKYRFRNVNCDSGGGGGGDGGLPKANTGGKYAQGPKARRC
jgi:hypothetical protein